MHVMSACQGATISLHSLWQCQWPRFPCAHALSALLSAVHCGPSAECRERGRYVSINSVTTSHSSHSQHAMCVHPHTWLHRWEMVLHTPHYNAHGPQHTITYNNIQ